MWAAGTFALLEHVRELLRPRRRRSGSQTCRSRRDAVLQGDERAAGFDGLEDRRPGIGVSLAALSTFGASRGIFLATKLTGRSAAVADDGQASGRGWCRRRVDDGDGARGVCRSRCCQR